MMTTNNFAARVLATAAQLVEPGRNVAIYDVYSRYGVDHKDAGSLDSFKARLVEAAKARLLSLARCDLPKAMDPEVRADSATEYHGENHHYVET